MSVVEEKVKDWFHLPSTPVLTNNPTLLIKENTQPLPYFLSLFETNNNSNLFKNDSAYFMFIQ